MQFADMPCVALGLYEVAPSSDPYLAIHAAVTGVAAVSLDAVPASLEGSQNALFKREWVDLAQVGHLLSRPTEAWDSLQELLAGADAPALLELSALSPVGKAARQQSEGTGRRDVEQALY